MIMTKGFCQYGIILPLKQPQSNAPSCSMCPPQEEQFPRPCLGQTDLSQGLVDSDLQA